MDIDPETECYGVPNEAEIIELNPFRLKYKDLAFSSVYVKSKM